MFLTEFKELFSLFCSGFEGLPGVTGLPIVEADGCAFLPGPLLSCVFALLHLISQLILKQLVSSVDVKTETRRDNNKLI